MSEKLAVLPALVVSVALTVPAAVTVGAVKVKTVELAFVVPVSEVTIVGVAVTVPVIPEPVNEMDAPDAGKRVPTIVTERPARGRPRLGCTTVTDVEVPTVTVPVELAVCPTITVAVPVSVDATAGMVQFSEVPVGSTMTLGQLTAVPPFGVMVTAAAGGNAKP